MGDIRLQVSDDYTTSPSFEVRMNKNDIKTYNLIQYVFVNVRFDTDSIKCLLLEDKDSTVSEGEIKLSKRTSEKLSKESLNGKEIYLKPDKFARVEVYKPKIEKINTNSIEVSNDIIMKYGHYVELINPAKGFRLLAKISKDSKPPKGKNSIRINRHLRLLTGLEDGKSTELIVTKAQENNNNRLIRFFKSFVYFVGNIFIGARITKLRVAHLYSFDEGYDLCRINGNTRKVLGIEENDKLIIGYKGKSISLPVIDYIKENIENYAVKTEGDSSFYDTHLVIGLPASARFELGVPNIGTIVTVRRNMWHLFLKHINRLVLPLIALLFSIIKVVIDLTKDNDKLNLDLIVAFFFPLLLLLIYVSFSDVRNKIR